jgi:hypothetical protein
MKTLSIFLLFVACVFSGAAFSTLVTTITWSIQVEPRALQCNDTCGWPFDNYWTSMDEHKGAGDAISPRWRWEQLERLREIYIAAFFVLWVASAFIPFRMLLQRIKRLNPSLEWTRTSRSGCDEFVAKWRLVRTAHAGR